MTLVDLEAAAQQIDARRARSRQRKLGASSVGGCRRQAAYIVSGTRPTDDSGSKMAAILGTWIHTGALTALKKVYQALIEVGLQHDLVRGNLDAMFLDLAEEPGVGTVATGATVEDLKTVGRFAFEWRYDNGVLRKHLYQVHLYAWLVSLGLFNSRGRRKLIAAGVVPGPIPVHTVVVRHVNRDNGEEFPHVQPYDPAITAEALEWLAEVYDRTAEGGPEMLARDEDGPGLSVVCDGCRFRTACWGPQDDDPRIMRQSSLVIDDADMAEALEQYDEFRRIAKEAEAGKALARAKLTGSEHGGVARTESGQWMRLGWSGIDKPGREVVDMEAVGKLYREAGLDLPMKRLAPSKTIQVRKAKPEEIPDESAQTTAAPARPVLSAVPDSD